MSDITPFDSATHWEKVYRTKSDTELSWHQDAPTTSLQLIREVAPPHARIIDIGGGTSLLGARLVESGSGDVTVLDISPAAIERGRERAGVTATRMHWLCADVLSDPGPGRFDLWHDRAVFHFLTDDDERQRYVARVRESVTALGWLIVATFALDGPERCSGLLIRRHSVQTLAETFAPEFELIRSANETHRTPWGASQSFVYVLMRRRRVLS